MSIIIFAIDPGNHYRVVQYDSTNAREALRYIRKYESDIVSIVLGVEIDESILKVMEESERKDSGQGKNG